VPYVRTVKTKSGATAVQVVWSSQRGSREIEHLGSAHDEAELEMLKAAGRQRIAAGQAELDLVLEPAGGGPLPITSSRMGCLLDALERGYRVLGLDSAADGDGVFRDLVLARIIEPVSKLDSLRVLDEAGVAPPSYRTVERRLPAYAQEERRQRLSAACAAHARLGPASLVLYDVSTLYFETDQGDGFREPGFSKERRLEPQITIGLLTGQDGFPLKVSAFEGNRAETKTMLPVIREFMAAHRLPPDPLRDHRRGHRRVRLQKLPDPRLEPVHRRPRRLPLVPRRAVASQSRPHRVPRDPQRPRDRLDRHRLRPVQPADLSPVLHCEHPLSPLAHHRASDSPEGVTFQPPLKGQFSTVADSPVVRIVLER
jgi:hypothetical protein